MSLPFLFLMFVSVSIYGVVHAQENAFALHGSKWDINEVQVTWENPLPENEQEREWVREAVANTWQAVADINFVNWGRSEQNSKGIRIRIRDDENGPHVKLLGKQIDGMEEGMVLNFTFNNWSPVMKNRRKDYIIAIAVHEFGHALGFAHEHNRKDCYFCDEKRQGTDGDYWITTCDPQSVMNYCNPAYSNWGILSQGDIKGVQTLYGKRQTTQPPPTTFERNVSLVHISRDLSQEEKEVRPNLNKFIQIYVTGSDRALNNIETVTYELHPTFQQRYYEVRNKESNFGLGIYVWGMFEVKAEITFIDGSRKNLTRYLSFDEIPQSPNQNETVKINHSVRVLSLQETIQANGNTHEVTLVLNESDTFLQNVSRVEYTLHPTFSPRVRVANNSANRFQIRFTCWGQFTVYGKVVMRNGRSYNFERYINF